MIIDSHDVSIKQINPIVWEILVECPNKIKMFGRIKTRQLNEELAYKIYRQNEKNFAIDIEVISVIVEETKDVAKEPAVEKIEQK